MDKQELAPPRRRAVKGLSGYQSAIADTYAPMSMESERAEQVPWQVVGRHVGAFCLSHVFSGGPVRAQVTAQAREPAGRRIVLMLVEDGCFEFDQGSRRALCGPKTLVLMNVGEPLEARQSGPVRILSVTLPTEFLRAQHPDIERRCGTVLAAGGGAAALLRDMVRSTWRVRDTLDAGQVRMLPGLFAGLIGCAFAGAAGDAAAAREAEHALRIRQVIEEELQNPALGPGLVARRLGISLSRLFAVARRSGTTVGQQILECRLQRCHQALADPASADRSITEIAFAWGFQELSHFSRRFSERFGLCPQEYRRRLARAMH
ncbi:MAG: helix-turn-helix domain-containing protein [Nevskia sp.]|nr:helix-turn-helix domain-containing protein [Nevskia sp.]